MEVGSGHRDWSIYQPIRVWIADLIHLPQSYYIPQFSSHGTVMPILSQRLGWLIVVWRIVLSISTKKIALLFSPRT